jgi:hypothetical protein
MERVQGSVVRVQWSGFSGLGSVVWVQWSGFSGLGSVVWVQGSEKGTVQRFRTNLARGG